MKPYGIINPHSTPNHSEDIVSRKIADEFLLVPISGTAGEVNSIYTLNEVAAFIWENLDGKSSVDAICVKLAEEFAVDKETAVSDAIELLEMLKSLGMITGC